MNPRSTLKIGATIGIVAPSRWPEPAWLEKGKAVLEKLGYKVVIHPQCYKKDGQLAGTDKERAAAVVAMFKDPKVDAILCGRGGTGANRMVDLLDFKTIKKHPKPFIGFSDITLLLQAIHKKCGFVTYHGPMMLSFARDHDKRTLADFSEVFAAGKKNKIIKFTAVEGVALGKAKGELIGGNLSLLQTLLGTEYDWDSHGKILFIEDVEEPLYKIDRMLNHFRLAGKLKGLKAVIVGEMIDISDGISSISKNTQSPYGRDLKQMLLELLPKNIPLCFNFPCGHGKYITTLPYGAVVTLTVEAKTATLQF